MTFIDHLFRCASISAILLPFTQSALAANITSDTLIDGADVAGYAAEELNVSAGATLTISLSPATSQTFSGGVLGDGKIVVENNGPKAIWFSGSFKDFTGELTGAGDVRASGLHGRTSI